jgi:hypothetical protein
VVSCKPAETALLSNLDSGTRPIPHGISGVKCFVRKMIDLSFLNTAQKSCSPSAF